ncbi:hypothetical protein KKC47_02460, partial [Patescibacteria group bacterium]|nr:hypothetical protein [Patescibacteria group bacterium]
AYRLARSPSQSTAVVDNDDDGTTSDQVPPAADEVVPGETDDEAPPATASIDQAPNGGSDSLATLPPPAKLVVDYTGGAVTVRRDGNLELRAKNAPFGFGEPAAANPQGTALANGDKLVVFSAPRALATDSTGCKATQVEYRLRPNGDVEVVTRGCTRITQWE